MLSKALTNKKPEGVNSIHPRDYKKSALFVHSSLPCVLDDLPRAEGLGASEAAERLGRGCVCDVAGEDGHRWRVFRTGRREQRVDMTIIEPYRKVLSHGGNGEGCTKAEAVALFGLGL